MNSNIRKSLSSKEGVITKSHETTASGRTKKSLTFDDGSGENIVIPFPEDKYTHYLKTIGIADENDLTLPLLASLMINIIGDFKIGKVCIDELAAIFNYLLWDYGTKNNLVTPTSEIGNILDNGAELAYHIRHAADDGEPNATLTEFSYSLMQFYEMRDTVLANIKKVGKNSELSIY